MEYDLANDFLLHKRVGKGKNRVFLQGISVGTKHSCYEYEINFLSSIEHRFLLKNIPQAALTHVGVRVSAVEEKGQFAGLSERQLPLEISDTWKIASSFLCFSFSSFEILVINELDNNRFFFHYLISMCCVAMEFPSIQKYYVVV